MNKEEFIEEVLRLEEENLKREKPRQWVIRQIVKLVDEGWEDDDFEERKDQ